MFISFVVILLTYFYFYFSYKPYFILKSIIVESENLTDQITLTPVQFESDDFLTVLIDLKSIDGLKFNQYYLTFYANERMWHY